MRNRRILIMKLTCNRDNLISGVNIVQKAVPAKSTAEILQGILIEVGEELRFTGNDNEFGIVYEIPAIIEEIGSIVVNSKTFGDIVRKLPDIYVTLETINDGAMLSITSGHANYKIKVYPTESYPPVAFLDTSVSFDIKEKTLVDLIRQTSFAAAQEEKRVILKGVFIEQKEGKLSFVAIDGFRLAKKMIDVDDSREFAIVVPTKILNELSKSIKGEEELIHFCCNENQIMFFCDTFRMVSKLYKGDYIDYRKMFPREYKTTCVVNNKSFLNAFERSSLVIQDEKKYPLTIKFMNNDEIIMYVNAENGILREVISSEVTGDEIEIGMCIRNILECLKAIDEDNIIISLTHSLGPCVITGVEDKSYQYLVMPVKITSKSI